MVWGYFSSSKAHLSFGCAGNGTMRFYRAGSAGFGKGWIELPRHSFLLGRWNRVGMTSLQVKFDGPALATGAMDVRDLAPALLAFGAFIEACNRELNGESASVSVRVRSDFKGHSFAIDFDLVQTLLEQAKTLFGANRLTSPEAIISAAIGAITLLKLLKGRKPTGTTIEIDRVRISVDGDYEEVEATKESVRIIRNRSARRALEAFLKPVEKEGIDHVDITHSSGHERITKQDVPYLKAPDDEEILTEQVVKMALTVLTVDFPGEKSWRFTDGGEPFTAKITDSKFLEQIEAGLRFGKGDSIIALVKFTQKRVRGRIRLEREVVEVLEHLPPTGQGSQIPLF